MARNKSIASRKVITGRGNAARNAGPSVGNELSRDNAEDNTLNTLDGVNMATVVNILGASNFPKSISSRSKLLKYIAVGLHVDVKELAEKLDAVLRIGEAKASTSTQTFPRYALGDALATVPARGAGNGPSTLQFSPALHHLLNALVQPHQAPGLSDVTEKISLFIESFISDSSESRLSETLEAPSTVISRSAMNSFSTVAPRIPDAILKQSGIMLMDHEGTRRSLIEYPSTEPNYCGVIRDADEIVQNLLGIQLNDTT
ncbi:hypothetical protein RUND412_007266 [Rhizina undulata]